MAKTSGDWQPIKHAAEAVGVHRVTLSKWVKAGRIPSCEGRAGNIATILVNVAQVRKLVGDGLKPGRPRKKDAE